MFIFYTLFILSAVSVRTAKKDKRDKETIDMDNKIIQIAFKDIKTQSAINDIRNGDTNTYIANSVLFNLTEANFNPFLADANKEWFLVLYTPWCPHCQHYLPKLNQLVIKLNQDTQTQQKHNNLNFATIDCQNQGSIAYQFGVETFPLMLYMRGGYTYEYIGKGDYDSINQFIQNDYQDSKKKKIPQFMMPRYQSLKNNPNAGRNQRKQYNRQNDKKFVDYLKNLVMIILVLILFYYLIQTCQNYLQKKKSQEYLPCVQQVNQSVKDIQNSLSDQFKPQHEKKI